MIRQAPCKAVDEGKDRNDGQEWKDHKHWSPWAGGRRCEALTQPTEGKKEDAEHEEKLAAIGIDFVPVTLRGECLSNTDTVCVVYILIFYCIYKDL